MLLASWLRSHNATHAVLLYCICTAVLHTYCCTAATLATPGTCCAHACTCCWLSARHDTLMRQGVLSASITDNAAQHGTSGHERCDVHLTPLCGVHMVDHMFDWRLTMQTTIVMPSTHPACAPGACCGTMQHSAAQHSTTQPSAQRT